MTSTLPFTFGIPLVGRAGTDDVARIEALLGLTLRSILAQTDPSLRVLVMSQDRPFALPNDPRVEFLEADWPAGEPDAANNDAGRKKHALGEAAMRAGEGHLMLVDADDWVPSDLVARARAEIGPEAIGGVMPAGEMIDYASGHIAPLPFPGAFERPFYALCGSSVVARLRPDDPDPLRRNPLLVLRDHNVWPEAAQAHGASVARLGCRGAYLVGTAQNHSECHGPYAAWRRDLVGALRTRGRPADAGFLARFGLDEDALRQAQGSWLDCR
ncbi:glycosyltransferase family A protein [Salinarimonas ramus]|uniref:Glycosyl transferase family 2 n=1 Tax=Salinarimonas ramus TaxID=690164 RepID=A0A917Q4K1_9HYPH|nr:glycosyltransferase family A protein [Salinarimonas ramus]GGK21703.1 hypothetical protein GCM10011322_05490 [Salinarimonas ramus]